MIQFNINLRFEAYYAAILAYYNNREHDADVGARHFIDADEQVIGLDNTLATVHIKPLIEARLEEKFRENPEQNVNPNNVLVLPSFSTRDLANIDQHFPHNHFFHFVLSHLNAIANENKEAIKHIVIPIHKDQNHYTTLNIELCDDGRAIVRYKDSMGHDYPNSTIPLVQLKAALENTMGYRIDSVTQYPDVQQNRDAVHCGLFTVRNAVDLINHRNDENKMPTCREVMLKNDEDYTKYWILARKEAVEILKAKGFIHVHMDFKLAGYSIALSEDLNKSLASIEFDVDCKQRVINAKEYVKEIIFLEGRVEVLRAELEAANQNARNEENDRFIRNKNGEIALKRNQIYKLNTELFRLVNSGRIRPMHQMNHSDNTNSFPAFSSNVPAPSRVVYESEAIDASYEDKISTLFFMAGLAASYFIYTLGFAFSGTVATCLALLTIAVTGMGALSYLNSILEEDGVDELGLNVDDKNPTVLENPDVVPAPKDESAPKDEPAPANNGVKVEEDIVKPSPVVTQSFNSLRAEVKNQKPGNGKSSKIKKAKSDGEDEVRSTRAGHASRPRANS